MCKSVGGFQLEKMEKENAVRQIKLTASFTRWSVAYNIIFLLNLATTPFMTYLTEPQPGKILPHTLPASTSFDEYVNNTSVYLQQLYNNETLSSSLSNRRDLATNTFSIRRDMAMPASMSKDDALSLLPLIPFAWNFGYGMNSFLVAFLTANETARYAMKPWQVCQWQSLAGLRVTELCLWLEQVESKPFQVYVGQQINEQPETVWIKFIYRLLLSLYILYVLWSQYYRHYMTLQLQLRQQSLSSAHSRYEIVVGDPAYVIMSNWTILLAMIVDAWLRAGYGAVAAWRVCQLDDFWLYLSGCMYLSRSVWCAYFGMRVMSSVAKWRRWEALFAPIDPSILSVVAYIYRAPCYQSSTRREARKGLGGEAAARGDLLFSLLHSYFVGVISMTLLMTLVPVPFSRLMSLWQRRQQVQVMPTSSLAEAVQRYSFNDLKALVLLTLFMRKRPCKMVGGGLHLLYMSNPRYRRLPLYSHRAADCFLLCYNADGTIDCQIRLSLVTFLDAQLDDLHLALSPCCPVANVDINAANTCQDCKMVMTVSEKMKCIHRGGLHSPWIE
ncbi:hypothetical protein LEN26_016327 [Aphanomyces euteiches]|nr:hypothetical protein LEN26_016327 [Aphanomyces euteiches]KAH9124927.1 hypothetical protein AeMF1_004390 [Aphanomyces euteiches]KAH9187305.1 hypothetical protein AeNC1_010721 [Aphanomyces euteiches]